MQTSAASAAALSLRGVSKSFDGGQTFAVRDVSIDVAKGEFIALVGGSGSGKTTTLKMLNRLIDPDGGDVILGGAPTQSVPGFELRRHVGYVFQGIGLFPHLSVGENIAITPRLLGWSDSDIASRVEELLDLVELPHADYAARLPAALSGGQQQRVGFARALAAYPSTVLMDEPFGALDPLTRDALAQSYLGLHAQLGLTSIMVTHDMNEALLLADRVGVMREGRLVEIGPAEELMRSGDEYVRGLLETPRSQAERIARKLSGERAS